MLFLVKEADTKIKLYDFICEVVEQTKFIYSDRSKKSGCSGMVGIDQVGAQKELSRMIEMQGV